MNKEDIKAIAKEVERRMDLRSKLNDSRKELVFAQSRGFRNATERVKARIAKLESELEDDND